jgi:hypothetical protein
MMMSTMTMVVMFGDDVDNDVGNNVLNDVGDDTKHVIHGIVSPCNNKFHEEQSLGLLGYLLVELFHLFHDSLNV